MTRTTLPANIRQKNRCIRADDATHERAAQIGNGSASKGYRMAVEFYPMPSKWKFPLLAKLKKSSKKESEK